MIHPTFLILVALGALGVDCRIQSCELVAKRLSREGKKFACVNSELLNEKKVGMRPKKQNEAYSESQYVAVYLMEEFGPDEPDLLPRIVKFYDVGSREGGRKPGKDAMEIEDRVYNLPSHPNIVKRVARVIDDRDKTAIFVFEYAAMGNLYELIHADSPFLKDDNSLMRVVRDVCRGLAHLHSHGIVHADLKPHNVVVTQGLVAQLTDFDLSHPKGEEGLRKGTRYYMAPELMKGGSTVYDSTTDIYSLGILIFELVTRQKSIWESLDVFGLQLEKMKGEFTLPAGLPLTIAYLIAGCMAKNPSDRLTLEEIIKTVDEYLELTVVVTISETRIDSEKKYEPKDFKIAGLKKKRISLISQFPAFLLQKNESEAEERQVEYQKSKEIDQGNRPSIPQTKRILSRAKASLESTLDKCMEPAICFLALFGGLLLLSRTLMVMRGQGSEVGQAIAEISPNDPNSSPNISDESNISVLAAN